MGIVTLTTDFGAGDYACGLLHGVVLSIEADAEVVDLTHDIPRHDVMSGALALDRALPYFPPGTVHVVVVDPGVGTRRRPLAAQLGDQFFVGPDNGLVTIAYQRLSQSSIPCRFCHMTQSAYWLPSPSQIFHGRDIFTPAAAHLAQGVILEKLGILINDPVLFDVPEINLIGNGITGQVIHVDHFGNLSTNIQAKDLSGRTVSHVSAGGVTIPGLAATFQDARDGELVAIIDSSNHLCICVTNGNAQKRLLMKTGDTVTVLFL